MYILTLKSNLFEKNLELTVYTPEDAFNTFWMFREAVQNRREESFIKMVDNSGIFYDITKGCKPLVAVEIPWIKIEREQEELVRRLNTFAQGMVNPPPEFEKSFNELFWDILA